MNAEACLTQRLKVSCAETLEKLFLLSFLSFSRTNICAYEAGAVPVEVISLLEDFAWEINFNVAKLGCFVQTLENIQHKFELRN